MTNRGAQQEWTPPGGVAGSTPARPADPPAVRRRTELATRQAAWAAAYAAGQPAARIAAAWNVNPSTVVRTLARMGVQMRRPGRRRRDEITAEHVARLMEEHQSKAHVARILDCSIDLVTARLKELGGPPTSTNQ